MPVRGRVASGRGDLAHWMRMYSERYQDALGVRLEPGSLNVVLDEPWVMHRPDVRLLASAVGIDGGLAACTLAGEQCWVIRTDKNNVGVGDHPLNVIEIVSAVHLRSALGLQDGDEVVVALRTAATAS